jgi:glycosyltransferase involved in cell wall biosynthesis
MPKSKEQALSASPPASSIASFIRPPTDSALRPILVCFSHLRWDFVYQRPQHLLTRASLSHLVFFIEEPQEKIGLTEPRLDIRPQSSGVIVVVPLLPGGYSGAEALAAQRNLLDELLESYSGGTTIFWYYTPMALRFSDHREPDLCLYDCMDELSGFSGAPVELSCQEARLFGLADLVFTGGQSLYEAKRTRHSDVHAFPSSIDRAHFGVARQKALADPADQAGLPGPRIGFFGVIDERMNMGLVARIAELRRDWQFVMLGPVVKIDPAGLPRGDNLHWLGSKAYQELPAYLAHWNAGFMPFAINDATRFISPTKTPEFLSAGLPVVSTPVRDVQRPYGTMGLVEIADDAVSFAQALGAVLSRPRGAWLRSVDAYLAGLSWDRTWSEMSMLMQAKLAQGKRSVSTTVHIMQSEESARV